MARYSHLPIYKLSYAFSRDVFRLLEKLPKPLKHTIGERLLDSSVECINGIIIANSAEEKLSHMKAVGVAIESNWTYLRLLHDFKGISRGELQLVSERLGEIGKQLSAWIKWEKDRQKQKNASIAPSVK